MPRQRPLTTVRPIDMSARSLISHYASAVRLAWGERLEGRSTGTGFNNGTENRRRELVLRREILRRLRRAEM